VSDNGWPKMIEDHPGPVWLARDLAVLDLPADGIEQPFDVIVSAGNVMTFLAPDEGATPPLGITT
jgi:hypothetical protein